MSDSQGGELRGESLGASLTVSDLERSVSWYVAALGFSEDRRHEREGKLIGVSLKGGAVRILLTQDDGAKGADRARGEAMSLQITTSQSIDDIASRVAGTGTSLDTAPTTMPWGVRIFRVRDPDGFRLTVSSPQPG